MLFVDTVRGYLPQTWANVSHVLLDAQSGSMGEVPGVTVFPLMVCSLESGQCRPLASQVCLKDNTRKCVRRLG